MLRSSALLVVESCEVEEVGAAGRRERREGRQKVRWEVGKPCGNKIKAIGRPSALCTGNIIVKELYQNT